MHIEVFGLRPDTKGSVKFRGFKKGYIEQELGLVLVTLVTSL